MAHVAASVIPIFAPRRAGRRGDLRGQRRRMLAMAEREPVSPLS